MRSGRRLSTKGSFFNDETGASDILKGHLFWLLLVFLGTTAGHLVILKAFRLLGFNTPKYLSFPQVEVVVFLGLVFGMLSTSSGVLVHSGTATGWKLVASVELAIALIFVAWFLSKGVLFSYATSWEPSSNVLQKPLKKCIPKSEADKEVHDFGEEGAGQKWIPYQKASPIEKAWAMVFTSRVAMGTYTVRTDDDHQEASTIEKESTVRLWGQFFQKFVPAHRYFYAANLLKQFAESFILNALAGHGLAISQSACMLALSVIVACTHLFESPYVLVAQSRSETIGSIGRVFVFFFSLLGAAGAMDKGDAANVMAMILLLLLLQSTITALWPILSDLFESTRARCRELRSPPPGTATKGPSVTRDLEQDLEGCSLSPSETPIIASALGAPAGLDNHHHEPFGVLPAATKTAPSRKPSTDKYKRQTSHDPLVASSYASKARLEHQTTDATDVVDPSTKAPVAKAQVAVSVLDIDA
mmetsp:Transcript_11296/g.26540  ORF Transcript_11296/g.26540 Transcript_11296/m.26540 type:complete len:473 (-) Transcript_11296:230-1648(-)